MNRAEFAKSMTCLRACYQNQLNDQGQWLASIATYWDVCRRYDDVAVRRAFASAWKIHPRWFPSLGQLVELIETPDTAGGSVRLSALDSWAEVVKYASGSVGSIQGDVAREAVRLMGGRVKLSRMCGEQFHVWARREFVELYESITQRRATRAALAAPPEKNLLRDRASAIIQAVSNAAAMPRREQ